MALGYYWRGQARLRKGDVRGALADFDASLTIVDPAMQRGVVDDRYQLRAECRARVGDPAGAVEDYATFLTLGDWVREEYREAIAARPAAPESLAMKAALERAPR